MIVIVLVFAIYALFFTNFDLSFNSKKSTVTLKNLKSYLLKTYSFNEKLKLICVDDGKDCYVLLDDEVSKNNKVENLFDERPEVYKYSASLDLISYERVTLEDQEDFEVSFEFTINKDRKSSEMIVFSEEKVYVYSALNDTPLILNYLNEVPDMFEEKISEVKDAF